MLLLLFTNVLFAWNLFSNGVEYYDCNDVQLEVDAEEFPIQVKDQNLVYKIDSWNELEKRSINLYKMQDNALMWKSNAKDIPGCLILKGSQIKDVIESEGSLKVVVGFSQDALLEVRTSSVDLKQVKHYKVFGSGTKFIKVDLSSVHTNQIQQIYLDYVYSSTLRSVENEGEKSLLKINELILKIFDDMQRMGTIDKWANTSTFDDFKRSTQVLAKFLGLPENDASMRAHIRGLGVGDSVQILRNLVKIHEILMTNRAYFDIEKISNLAVIISNIMSIYEVEFAGLCTTTIDVKLPFVDSETLNVYETFNFVLKRVSNILQINSYEAHKPFVELLASLENKGLSYKQAINDPATKSKIVEAYDRVKASSAGLPSLSLAQAEVSRLKDLSAALKHLEIYKELFSDLELTRISYESEYFVTLKQQLDLLQAGADKNIRGSQDLKTKLLGLLDAEVYLVDTLKSKTAKLAEIMSYLDEVDPNVVYVGRFCH